MKIENVIGTERCPWRRDSNPVHPDLRDGECQLDDDMDLDVSSLPTSESSEQPKPKEEQ